MAIPWAKSSRSKNPTSVTRSSRAPGGHRIARGDDRPPRLARGGHRGDARGVEGVNMSPSHLIPAATLHTMSVSLLEGNGYFTNRAAFALTAVLRTAQLLNMHPADLLRELSAQSVTHFCTQLRRVPDADVQRCLEDFLEGVDLEAMSQAGQRSLANTWATLLERFDGFESRLEGVLFARDRVLT
ncbi:MAG: hypothetical protein HC933_15600 [Pleurocapsa sp. SU_196_0]|nr:hypothetical protein [Pleurocapsa sp. SU_196_0]